MRLLAVTIVLLAILSLNFTEGEVFRRTYQGLQTLGIEVSMTPLTFDMSLMTDGEGKSTYGKSLVLRVRTSQGTELSVDPRRLDFYRHKIPLLLFQEALSYGGQMPEGRSFLCASLGEFASDGIAAFGLFEGQGRRQSMRGLDEFHNCL